jgi:serine/threonine protein phosphatase PrpC
MAASKFSTLQDNSVHGEDSLVTRDLGDGDFLDVVMDGVTGHGGADASRDLGEALSQGNVDTVEDIVAILADINDEFYQVGQGRFLLTTVSAALYRGGRLNVVAAGDSPIFLVDKESHTRLCGRAGGFLHVGVARAIGAAAELGDLAKVELEVEQGARLVLATDGVTDNMQADELAEIVRTSSTPEEATQRVEEIISGRLVEGRVPETLGVRFRNDDRTAIIRFFE